MVARVWAQLRATTIARHKRSCKVKFEDEIIEPKSRDETEEFIFPLVHHISVCENAVTQAIESWMKENNQYEITVEEIVTLVSSLRSKIDDQAFAFETQNLA